jgi:hypothetical protein
MRSPCCLCVCVPSNVARQRLGKRFPAVKNTHEIIEELLGAVFSVRSVSYQILYLSVKNPVSEK